MNNIWDGEMIRDYCGWLVTHLDHVRILVVGRFQTVVVIRPVLLKAMKEGQFSVAGEISTIDVCSILSIRYVNIDNCMAKTGFSRIT